MLHEHGWYKNNEKCMSIFTQSMNHNVRINKKGKQITDECRYEENDRWGNPVLKFEKLTFEALYLKVDITGPTCFIMSK